MKVETPLSAVGVFRVQGKWRLAFGQMAGKNALSPKIEVILSDAELRKFYDALQVVRTETGTNPPKRLDLPLLQPPVWVTWEGFLTVCLQVQRRVEQLDRGMPIPDSEQHNVGSLN